MLDHEEGLLVQSGESYAMAGAILDIYKNPGEAHRLGKNARIRGQKRNDGKKIVKSLVKIYEQIIENA